MSGELTLGLLVDGLRLLVDGLRRIGAPLVEPERRVRVGHQRQLQAPTRSTHRSMPSTKSKIPRG